MRWQRRAKNSFLLNPISVLSLILLAALVLRVLFTGHVWEDAYITFRYVRNLTEGQGFVFNPGERVLGTTTPLYALVVSTLVFLGAPLVATGQAIGILADIGSATVTYVVSRRIMGGWFALVPVGLFGLSNAMLYWSTSGMETSLYIFFTLMSFLMCLWRRYFWMAVFLAATVLTRIDGLLLMAVLTLSAGIYQRSVKLAVQCALIFTALVLPWVIFSLIYFGSPIPHTVTAKQAAYVGTLGSYSLNISSIGKYFLEGTINKALFTCAVFGTAITAVRWRAWLPLPLWVLAWYLFLVLSQTHIHPWYLLPPLPIYYLLISLGLKVIHERFWTTVRRIPRGKAVYLMLVGATGLLFLGAKSSTIASSWHETMEEQRLNDMSRKAVGQWLNTNSHPNSVVALEPIGYIGFFSERYILDLIGLVSPQTVPFHKSRLGFLAIIKTFMPDYYVRSVDIQPLDPEGLSWIHANYRPVALFSPSDGLRFNDNESFLSKVSYYEGMAPDSLRAMYPGVLIVYQRHDVSTLERDKKSLIGGVLAPTS